MEDLIHLGFSKGYDWQALANNFLMENPNITDEQFCSYSNGYLKISSSDFYFENLSNKALDTRAHILFLDDLFEVELKRFKKLGKESYYLYMETGDDYQEYNTCRFLVFNHKEKHFEIIDYKVDFDFLDVTSSSITILEIEEYNEVYRLLLKDGLEEAAIYCDRFFCDGYVMLERITDDVDVKKYLPFTI